MVHYHDARSAPSDPTKTKAVWSLQAHDESVSAFDVNPIIPGYFVTGSTDKEVKLWNIQPGTGPSMVITRDLGVGKVFSTTFAPDQEVGFRLAVAGSKGAVQIWDTSTNVAVRRIFAERIAPGQGEVKERLVTLQEDDDDSDSEEGDEDAGEGAEQDGVWEDEDGDAMEE
jgi:periodic tryptophan protein 1